MLLMGISIPLIAQEYETDRIFLRWQEKNHCLIQVQKSIKAMKKLRPMTNEHVLYLNRDIRNREKSGINLSKSQRIRRTQLQEGKSRLDFPSLREIQLMKKLNETRMKKECRKTPSQ